MKHLPPQFTYQCKHHHTEIINLYEIINCGYELLKISTMRILDISSPRDYLKHCLNIYWNEIDGMVFLYWINIWGRVLTISFRYCFIYFVWQRKLLTSAMMKQYFILPILTEFNLSSFIGNVSCQCASKRTNLTQKMLDC